MADERKFRDFKRGLSKPGMAAQVREEVSQVIRQSSNQTKVKLTEPLDYETVVLKNKTLINNDPHRELLLFPHDDLSQSTLPRRFRTVRSSVPQSALNDATSLLVKECIKTYTNNWHVIHFKYNAYSGSYRQLPKLKKEEDVLPEHTFEIDAEIEGKDEEAQTNRLTHVHVTKQGWLYKMPDGREETSRIIFTKSNKRRYFYLKQQADCTYILEFHKDDQKLQAKGSIFLDSAIDVAKTTKRGKYAFEIQMQDKRSYVLAAESDAEMEDWLKALKKIIQTQENNVPDLGKFKPEDLSGVSPAKGDFRESLQNSMNPELVKYAKETDKYLASLRNKERLGIFDIYPDMQRSLTDEPELEPEWDVFKEQFGKRFVVRYDSFKLRLQANIAEDGKPERLDNPEPFFISLALYDAKEGIKISEDFHIDPNSQDIREMIPRDLLLANDQLNTIDGQPDTQPDLYGVKHEWLQKPHQAIFSIMKPNSDIYLVAKIEKVLQGGITQSTEPYIKSTDVKMGTRIHKHMKMYSNRIGHYRMPFAWAVRPIFRQFSGELETESEMKLYRQDSTKIEESEIIKQLQDYRRPEKQSKWQIVPGSLKITISSFRQTIQNTLTPTMIGIKPFPDPPEQPPTLEMEEFVPRTVALEYSFPYTTYTNHLYVYPRVLKYDSQKTFAKARNLACCIELRASDADGCIPLKRLYGKPGVTVFTTVATTSVLHHQTVPNFSEEVKIVLPTQVSDRHHLLFTFYHVSCEVKQGSKAGTSKKGHNIETVVGHAWLPLFQQNRLVVGEHQVSVSSSLPPGYLTHQPLGMGRGSAGPEIKWVDGGKQLFKVDLQLASTIYTKDQHLHNFFDHCQRMQGALSSASQDFEASNKLKSLHAVDVGTLINFLPTLFNQLIRLLPRTSNEDVALNAVRVLIHVVSAVQEANKEECLHSYIKYVFVTEISTGAKDKSVHEELAKNLTSLLRPANADVLVIGKFLHHSWFFFELIMKSMAQHLLSTGRIKMQRHERFSANLGFRMQNMVQAVVSHIVQKHREVPLPAKYGNESLAKFIKGCFSLMDRGFVFRLINNYMDNFNPGDPKVLQEYKFEFLRVICSHEHYIPLNLPLMRKQNAKSYKDMKHDYTLSEEFRKNHFLVGLLLHEEKMALNELNSQIRRCAISVLRNLLAKHAFDPRYQEKSKQARIASLYLPLITILLENKSRLDLSKPELPTPGSTNPSANGDAIHEENTSMKSSKSSEQAATPTTTTSASKARDPAVLAMISGVSSGNLNISGPKPMNGSTTSLASTGSSTQSNSQSVDGKVEKSEKTDKISHQSPRSSVFEQSFVYPAWLDVSKPLAVNLRRSRSLSASITQNGPSSPIGRHDRLEQPEVKDLLICFLSVVKNLSEDVLLGWFNNSSETDVIDFFAILDICVHQFKYQGKKRIYALSMIGDSRKALTLPPKRSSAMQQLAGGMQRAPSTYSEAGLHSTSNLGDHTPSASSMEAVHRTTLEGCLATEIGVITLDILSLYTVSFKSQLEYKDGDNPIMQKLFDLYMRFLSTNQSQTLLKHVFAALRAFLNKFPKVLFKGKAEMCGTFCYQILRCCNSRLLSIRQEACALIYLLMRTNFEFSRRESFTRVHLQMIISVSQLISDVVGLSGTRFQESLIFINSFANNDKAMQKTRFPTEVKDLTKRIRTVLMATSQMKEHQNDPEMLVDLQYSLAKSYASTPELRKTWLDSMARIHTNHGNHSEAAHCYLHEAALVAEYLKRRGSYPQGCSAFKKISANIETDEMGIKDDSGMQDVQYTEETLVEMLEKCCREVEKSERYEMLGDIYKLIIPIYEQKRDFQQLTMTYNRLHDAYANVVMVMQTGKRLLGKYFRVAFYGTQFFEEEDGKTYIYKEPKVTGLPEICERLKTLYSEKFGRGNVRLIQDSNRVNPKDLDSRYAYIQITYVTPYFDEKELQTRLTDFERNNNIQRFMFETPFTKSDKAHGAVHDQYKRRTILRTNHSFPYLKKRILVAYHHEVELTPIEVAIDEIQTKVNELVAIIAMETPDLIKLQLKLQGSVSATVNAGPLAYATAFLEKTVVHKFDMDKVKILKEVFKKFVRVCSAALELNSDLIQSDQYEYHESLRTNFQDMVEKLQDMFGEILMDGDASIGSRSSLTFFNVISSTGTTSTV